MRSLNTSTKNEVTFKKLVAVTQNKDDIVLMCDLRLNSAKNKTVTHDVEKMCFGLGYNSYFHSTLPSRGVGILIKIGTDCKIINTIRDDLNDNFILINAQIGKKRVTIGSVYGPNHDTEAADFYNRLKIEITTMGNSEIIISGDWNATWDNSRVGKNIDILNMTSLPSLIRTNLLLKMADSLNLTDPYRIFYPDRREFTFIPSSANQKNRSRLDFFLLSKPLSSSLINCTIPNATNGTMFDHKQISLSFRKKVTPKCRMLKDHVFDSNESNAYVKASAFECFLQHSVLTENFNNVRRESELRKVGSVLNKLKDLRELEIQDAESETDPVRELRIEGLRVGITADMEELPDMDFFNSLTLSCNPSVFLEVLIICIKNTGLLYQSHVYKKQRAKLTNLEGEIQELKKNFRENVNNILDRERELAIILETQLKSELKHMKTFERLNNEKITPHFMALTKQSKSEQTLSDILNDDGTPFNSVPDLNKHITSFYKNLYNKQTNTVPEIPDIDDFLGDIAATNVIIEAKLSKTEQENLDLPLNITELDKSMNDANFNSAPGMNGISNKFIRKHWDIFRQPLFRCTAHIFETGTLPDSFKTAKIKLIPKKGN